MNRGRKRGGPGLTGLRDGVKRRLFDPHLVPTKPDEKNTINRLLPVASPNSITIHSRLATLRKSKDGETSQPTESSSGQTDKLCSNLIHSKSVFELAFRKGPFYQSLPEASEGIDIGRVYGTPATADASEKPGEPVLFAHLLLAHRDISLWNRDAQFDDLADPEEWYPKELVQFTKPGKKSIARQKARQKSTLKLAAGDRVTSAVNDLAELVPEALIQQSAEVLEEDEVIEKPEAEQEDAESVDSDDARWNGEVNADADPDELDEEELDNDYCQTYFDNGEGDLSDTGLGGGDDDDDGRAKYYD